MTFEIVPSKLTGSFRAVASKSFAARAIVAAFCCSGFSLIKDVEVCEDVLAVLFAAKRLGAKFKFKDGILHIFGVMKKSRIEDDVILDCGDSAFCFRVFSFLAAALGVRVFLKGTENLLKRPLIASVKLNGQKINYIERCHDFFKVNLKFKCGKYEIDGNVSSQFVSALLFSLPILEGDSEIEINGELQSKPYVELTLEILQKFGINIKRLERGFKVFGNQRFTPCELTVEKDHSQAAFFEILGVLNPIEVVGLNKKSLQGDRVILKIIEDCGAGVFWHKDKVLIYPPKKKIKPFKFCVENTPDLAIPLAILACFCCGISKIFGVRRLRYKESDRINSIFNLIKNLKGNVVVEDDAIKILGGKRLKGGFVRGFKDHRVVMAAFVVSCFCEGHVIVSDVESIFKSNINFLEKFEDLGGIFSGVCLG